MAHPNLKTKKKKEYNPIVTRTIKTQSVGKIRCFIKVVKPNPKDVFGTTKAAGFWYNMEGSQRCEFVSAGGAVRPDENLFL